MQNHQNTGKERQDSLFYKASDCQRVRSVSIVLPGRAIFPFRAYFAKIFYNSFFIKYFLLESLKQDWRQQRKYTEAD